MMKLVWVMNVTNLKIFMFSRVSTVENGKSRCYDIVNNERKAIL